MKTIELELASGTKIDVEQLANGLIFYIPPRRSPRELFYVALVNLCAGAVLGLVAGYICFSSGF